MLIQAFSLALLFTAADTSPKELFRQIIDQHADEIVTIRFVMKMQMGGRGGFGDQEHESEIQGLMIDPSGLVLCSNTQLGGFAGMMKRMMGSIPGFDMTNEPTDLEVVIGADQHEFEAELVARDTDLDLAWIRITNLKDQEVHAIALEDHELPEMGQTLYCVHRLGKHFNRAPAIRTGRVCGHTDTPRSLWVAETELASGIGLPVFHSSGKLAGVIVMQMPEAESGEGSFNPFAMMGSMSEMQGNLMGLILPADEVAKATKRVREAHLAASKPAEGEE